MNRQRAEVIVNSGEIKNITYNGERIYIQQVDEHRDVARVYPLDDPQNEFEVPLNQLEEK